MSLHQEIKIDTKKIQNIILFSFTLDISNYGNLIHFLKRNSSL